MVEPRREVDGRTTEWNVEREWFTGFVPRR